MWVRVVVRVLGESLESGSEFGAKVWRQSLGLFGARVWSLESESRHPKPIAEMGLGHSVGFWVWAWTRVWVRVQGRAED